jgi:hypothetical protein
MSNQTGQKQVHQMAPAAPSRPARQVLSDDQLLYVDQPERLQRQATEDPYLNGQDSRRRWLAHEGENQ